MSSKQPKKPSKKKLSDRKALYYTNLGFQLLAAIAIGVLIGNQIDKYFMNDTPYATAAGGLLGITAGIYLALKDLL